MSSRKPHHQKVGARATQIVEAKLDGPARRRLDQALRDGFPHWLLSRRFGIGLQTLDCYARQKGIEKPRGPIAKMWG